MNNILLDVKDLHTEFRLNQRTVRAVNGVSFQINQGQVLGIVGESGSGKSVTALSVMRLIAPPGYITSGAVLLHEKDHVINLLDLPARTLEDIRGNKISMIFQDPMTSLNPVLTVGYQLMEPLILHRSFSQDAARKEAARLLDRVGIPQAKVRLNDFPHQFSGGMRQRVMVAMAVACRPRLLIADEPTTALDVTIQAQIIDLINELKDEIGTSVMIITHDLGVVAEMANHVAVMYAGHIVEYGPVGEIFASPEHPYTRALMGSIPRLRSWPERLTTIEGAPPSLTDRIEGCPFKPRCPLRISKCDTENPPLELLKPGHSAACWVAQGVIPTTAPKGAASHA